MTNTRDRDAEATLHLLHRASTLLDAMAMGMSRIVFQYQLKETLMALKDEIKQNLADAAVKVKALRDAKAAATADATAKQEQVVALQARIAELEAMPGSWTDGDIAEIKDSLAALNTAFDPDTTVANIFENTPTT